MLQYYSVKHKRTSKESGLQDKKATVEIILKQLEYVTKGHIAMHKMLF